MMFIKGSFSNQNLSQDSQPTANRTQMNDECCAITHPSRIHTNLPIIVEKRIPQQTYTMNTRIYVNRKLPTRGDPTNFEA